MFLIVCTESIHYVLCTYMLKHVDSSKNLNFPELLSAQWEILLLFLYFHCFSEW